MEQSWISRSAAGLPDRLILFDGECVLCSRWAMFVIARDAEARFRFVAIQSPAGAALAKKLDIDTAAPETNAVTADSLVHFKSDSALAVLERLPGWRWTRHLRLLPKAWRDWAYDRIARNRYALFGKRTCFMPSPEIRARFPSDASPDA